MKLAIYTKGGIYFSYEDLKYVLDLASIHNLELKFNIDFAIYIKENYSLELDSYKNGSEINSDFMVSFGGDGTFLQAVVLLGLNSTPILGVNSGRLGFLSTVDKVEFELALKSLISGDYIIEKRSMISVKGDFNDNSVFPYLFNEFTIQKSELNMVDISLDINNYRAFNIAADGIIISTPSGSTAYSLSSGGSILSPDCKAFIITPIAPHNLTLRPIVVDDSSILSIKVNSRMGHCYATLDNRSYKINSGSIFNLELSPHKVLLIKLKGSSFFETLRKKLMWGSGNIY